MNPKERNRREWERPENWHGPGIFAFYAAENDTRILVPKRRPWMGQTINLAQPVGRAILMFLIALALMGIVFAAASAARA